MCRLLGYVTRTPATLADLLGEADLFEFTELSCKHGDGWGAAWATDTGVEVVKAPDAARVSSAVGRRADSRSRRRIRIRSRTAPSPSPTTGRSIRPHRSTR